MSDSVMTQILMVEKKKQASVIIELDIDSGKYIAKTRRDEFLLCQKQTKEDILAHLETIKDSDLYLCHFCKGTGLRLFENCQNCDGTGKLLTYFIAE